MLKILPPENLGYKAKEKCAEIFCHSSIDFTIVCTFCNMKAFSFDDFVLHIQNVHFVNNLLNNFPNEYFEVEVKYEPNEDITDELKEEELEVEEHWDNLEHSLNDASDISENEEEEETISVLKTSMTTLGYKSNKNLTSRSESDNHSLDEDIKTLLNEHKFVVPEENPYQCEQCNKSYKNIGLLKAHKTRIHYKHDKNSHDKVAKTPKTRVHNEVQLDKVVKKENSKELNLCSECNEIFPNIKDFDNHNLEIHGGYKCPHCDKRFKKSRALKRHEQCHTAEKKFVCNFEGCGKKYITQFDLKRHSGSHATERNFICDFENCGKAFQSAYYLQQHSVLHTRPKSLVCDFCGDSFKCMQNLKIHLRRHTGEKPFACEVCDKRFISNSAKTEHMNTHSNERRHVCKVCSASFCSQKSLYHHSFLHLDGKKFKCKLCDAAFKQAAGLSAHMRSHQEDD